MLLPADGPNVPRCRNAGSGDDLSGLREALFDLPGTVVIQFNFGFYEFAALASLIDALKNAGVWCWWFSIPQLTRRDCQGAGWQSFDPC